MPISKATRKSILETITDHHLAFMSEILGTDVLEHDEQTRLLTKGMLPKDPVDLIQKAYEFGAVNGVDQLAIPKNTSLLEFIRMSALARPELSSDSQEAIEHARNTTAVYIRNLGAQLVKKAEAIIVEGDRKLRRLAMLKTKSLVTEASIAKEVTKALKKAIEAQKAEFFKTATTNVNDALQEGRMHAIVKAAPLGKDPLVYKKPAPDCCPYCRLLFLKGDGVTPRLYRLSELIENGSNVGRKPGRPLAKSCGWKATVGSTHPACRCPLHYMPPGFEFNAKGVAVYKGRKAA